MSQPSTADTAGSTAPGRVGVGADGANRPLIDAELMDVLPRRLRSRHLSMIGIGGVIGAGLFVGSGAGVAIAGPGILLSYLGAGALAIVVMRMLGEMVAAYPANGAFSVHAERALGRWAGFTVGWMYWIMLVVVLAIEATGAGVILHGWVPGVSQWVWVLILVLFFTITNLATVGTYGEMEFWFATIKVVAIVGFIALGLLATFGLLPNTHAVGFTNLTGHGGFLPHGWSGVLSGLLAVVFAFGGLELVTIAAAEAGDPARAIGRAVSSTVWRILLFYVGSMVVVVMLLPWNDSAIGKSPYVAVLDRIGIPATGDLMNVVVLLALLSALNANLYGASRMMQSLAIRGEAPKMLQGISGRGVPYPAILVSVVFGFVSVFLSYEWPDTVFLRLANAIGGVVLAIWAMIACTQLRMRRLLERNGDPLVLRMWGYPYVTWAALAVMAVITVLLLARSDTSTSTLSTIILMAVVVAASLIREAVLRRRTTVS
jgi:aromatic amino acid permease